MKGPPQRHWRSYGNDVLPSSIEALDQPYNGYQQAVGYHYRPEPDGPRTPISHMRVIDGGRIGFGYVAKYNAHLSSSPKRSGC